MLAVLRIQIRRIRMFSGLPYPDTGGQILPFSHKGVERIEIMLAKLNFDTKF
jgi:hypothetical protein